MRSAQELLASFAEEYRRAGDANPAAYLEQARPQDRAELLVLIDAFLARQPRRRASVISSEEAVRWEPAVETLERALTGVSGSWPELLPRLRRTAGLRRAEVVDRLAAALDVSAKREKVALYYHEMEQGRLPARGVSDRVLDALAKIVDTTRDALRTAGRATLAGPGPIEPSARTAFTRVAPSAVDETAVSAIESAPGEPPDEVDELFLGG